jgi:RimJ/RimL family protein N-acetyltransferase
MFKIPSLQTERLLLRPQNMSDWREYEKLMMSDRARFMGGPYTKAAAWGLFCSDHAQWDLMNHGALMIDELSTGKCLGQAGINHGPLFPEKEIGWFLYKEAEGNGYAYEASGALKKWVFDATDIETLVSYIDPENIPSIKLAQKLGAVLDEKAARPDATDLVFRHAHI